MTELHPMSMERRRSASPTRLPILLALLFLLSHLSFLACFATSSSAPNLQSDAQALLAFLHALSSAKRVSWNPNASPCSWIGVICSPQADRVWSLRLPASGLRGQISPNTLGLLSELRFLSLRSNKLFGPVPLDLRNCSHLRGVHFEHNTLSGALPSFSPSPQLTKIVLSFNNFSGSIPLSYNGLPHLGTLLLQNNSLTGSIPPLKLRNLKQFNVSNNKLNGSIPSSLKGFSSSAFSGNDLCGPPVSAPCVSAPYVQSSPAPGLPPPAPLRIVPAQPKKSRRFSTGFIVAIAVGGVALLFSIAVCLLLCFLKKKSFSTSEKPQKAERSYEKGDNFKDDYGSAQEAERNKLVFLGAGNQYTFDLEDLLRASAEVLGKGIVGTSYKAVIEDGSTVVVKRLKDVTVGRKEFEQLMEVIGRLRHRNLVPVRAYYYSKDEKLLVLDYLPSGSLSSLLHGSKGSGRTPLDWDTRVKIAVGAARGIVYLHEQGSGKFTHGNIKSSNVLLDRDFDASVSDFGLAPLFGSVAAAPRMVGYRAPEVTETRKVTQKSDVYSFGVLLLELLTGKSPLQTSNEEGIDLPRWVQSVVREEWTAEVFDVELMRYQNIEEEMVQTLQIAMACVTTMPDQRPTMVQVLKMIEDVRQFETDDGNRVSSSDKSKQSEEQTPPRTNLPPESSTSATGVTP